MTGRQRQPLSIAGSDPTGGAGIEADLKVFLAHGFSGSAVATALTLQNTLGVVETNAEPLSRFRARLDLLLADTQPSGIKTGLLPTTRIIGAVASALEDVHVPLIVDPVLAPSRGPSFLDESGVRQLRKRLLPQALLLTPNIEEAARLTGLSRAEVRRSPDRATRALRETGVQAVLLTGGDGRGSESRDLLDYNGELHQFALPRVGGAPGNAHGTGCALSSAILSQLLAGAALPQAVKNAKKFVHAALKSAAPIGRGRYALGFAAAAGIRSPRSQ